LADSEKELSRQKRELEEKNAALRQVLSQIEMEKRDIIERIRTNIERRLMPTIAKLKRQTEPMGLKYIDMLQRNIEQLTSDFGIQLGRVSASLSPREIEVCDMVRNGMSTKEAAQMLHISPATVLTLRNRIRRKLGLLRKGVNLVTHLQSLSRESTGGNTTALPDTA
jgi:DNA-binding CsgD family transcriptional regulator